MTIDQIITIVGLAGGLLGVDRLIARKLGSRKERTALILKAARRAARDIAHLLHLRQITAAQAIMKWEMRVGRLLDDLHLYPSEAERQLAFEEAFDYFEDLAVGVAVGELRDAVTSFKQGMAELQEKVKNAKGWLP